MKAYFNILTILILVSYMQAQDKLHDPQLLIDYKEIPAYPDNYNEFTTIARLIDGLGYRYYWATEGLEEAQLIYQPGPDSRTTRETLEHIMILCRSTAHTCTGLEIIRDRTYLDMEFDELRRTTLAYIGMASTALKAVNPDQTLNDFPIRFKRGEDISEFPFWNLINGQISDAIYHVGQIVSYRRSAGNPLDSGVNVFTGKTRNQ